MKSFKTCALTTNTDGSEDRKIKAVKELNIFDEHQEQRLHRVRYNIEDDVFSSTDDDLFEDDD